jgi:hypothetical protein
MMSIKNLTLALTLIGVLLSSCKNEKTNEEESIVEQTINESILNVFDKDGQIYVKYSDEKIIELDIEGNNSLVSYSSDFNIIVYSKLETESKFKGVEGEETFDQESIWAYNVSTAENKKLFTTCLDHTGGTIPDYAKTDDYPFNDICGFEKGKLTPSGDKLFFQTYAWATSSAIHCYNLKDNSLTFYLAGDLGEVTNEGVEVSISAIEMLNGESKGRYFQTLLYDYDGKVIKELTEKQY